MSSALVNFSRRVPKRRDEHPDPVVDFSTRVPARSALALFFEGELRRERERAAAK